MAIQTSVARHYAIRMIALAVVCLLFGLWGAYDLLVKIPREEQQAELFEELTRTRDEMVARRERGETLTPMQLEAAHLIEEQLAAFEGRTPERPSAFDRLTQWIAISCFLGVPYFAWQLVSARRRSYRLEDDGTLVTLEGRWPQADVADIDMSRWMAKSIADVVHRDGRRVRLDDYVQRDTHLIVGHVAHRFYPEQWDQSGKRRNPEAGDAPATTSDSPAVTNDSDAVDSEQAGDAVRSSSVS